jgi:hypothetical protein
VRPSDECAGALDGGEQAVGGGPPVPRDEVGGQCVDRGALYPGGGAPPQNPGADRDQSGAKREDWDRGDHDRQDEQDPRPGPVVGDTGGQCGDSTAAIAAAESSDASAA